MKKRLVAFMLVLTMCWSSTVNFSSGAFTAYAETPEKEFEESSPAGEEEGEGLPENPAGETQGLPEANPSPESAGGSDPEEIPAENKDAGDVSAEGEETGKNAEETAKGTNSG